MLELDDASAEFIDGSCLGHGLHRDRQIKAVFDFHHQIHDLGGIEICFLCKVGVASNANSIRADNAQGFTNRQFDRGR